MKSDINLPPMPDPIVRCRSCGYVGPCNPPCCEHPDYDGASAEEAWCAAIGADRQQRGEAIAWESKTHVFRKFVTDSTYQRFSTETKKWYKPYKCSSCEASQAKQCGEPVAQIAEDFVFLLRKQPNGERWPVNTKLYVSPPLQSEYRQVLEAVDQQFDLYGDRLPDGFDSRVFRWVRDALAAPQPAVPDDDFHYKIGCFIDHATGGRLSKLNWPLEALRSAHDDNVQAIVEDALKEAAEPVKVPSDDDIIDAVEAYGRAYSMPNTTASELSIRLHEIRALLARYGGKT